MSVDLNLPTFGLNCREWLVATEADGLLVDEADGAPVVAVLSTAVVAGQELHSARAVFSLALLDEMDDDTDDTDDGDDTDGDGDGGGDDTDDDGFGPARQRHGGQARRRHGQDATARAVSDQLGPWAGQDICVLDADWDDGYARFAVAAPGGELAVVAEFSSAPGPSRELIDRFYDLVTSFRWAA